MSMRLLKVSTLLLVGSLALFLWAGVALAGFTDVPDNHWAAANIKKMSERGVVGGYTDGTFKPNKTVSQVEAVCMAVRAMGLNASSAANLPEPLFPVPNWAEEDVKLALRYGLVKDGDQFSAYAGATRAWVARLLVRMIGEETRAQEEALLSNFTDANIIPDWAAPYVRVAQDRNLIAGYTGNEFRPNQTVTRAEMVAFLSRADSMIQGNNANYLSGVVVDVSSTQIIITLDNGQTSTFNIPAGFNIYDEHGVISLTALQRFDRVKLLADENTLRYLEKVDGQQVASVVSGKVLKVFTENNAFTVEKPDGSLQILSLPEDADVSVIGSSSQGLGALHPGDMVEVTLNSAGYVTGIVVNQRSGSNTEGYVFDLDLELDGGLLTIQSDNNRLTPFRLADSVMVGIKDVRFPTLRDIRKGDRVKLTVENELVTGIEVLEVGSLLTTNGNVVLLEPSANLINLDVEGRLQAYRISPNVSVTVPGLSSAYLSNVVEGDNVNVTVKDGLITSIEVTGRQVEETRSVTVIAVDTGNRVLTVKDNNGNLMAYDVMEEARILVNGEEASLSQIARDMEVKVRLLDEEIIYIEADNAPGGIVASIDDDGLILVLQQDNGERKTYIIDSDVDVDSEDSRNELDDIRPGDYVKIFVEDERVKEIHLQTIFTYSVEEVRESSERLDVVDEDGDEERLYVRDGVEIKVPGTSYPDLEDISIGDTIRAVYIGKELKEIEVITPIRGKVVSIDIVQKRINLELFNGRTTTFEFTSGSRVKFEGKTYNTISSVGVGDRVEVYEEYDGSYVINVMEEATGTLIWDGKFFEDEIYIYQSGVREEFKAYEDVNIVDIYGNLMKLDELKRGSQVTLYILRDIIYQVVKES